MRSLWKQLDGFLVSEASEREVIESIVDRSLTKYRIDSAHIPIKVPDLLLRECEKEIRKVSQAEMNLCGFLPVLLITEITKKLNRKIIQEIDIIGTRVYEL